MNIQNSFPENIDFFRALVTNFPGGSVFMFDHDLRYLVAGGEIFRALHFSADQFVGKTIYETPHLGIWMPYEAELRAALRGESRTFTGAFGPLHYQAHAYPAYDSNGIITGCVVVGLDITPLKTKEIELERRARFERLIADISSTFINLPLSDFDEMIHTALHSVAQLIGADRAFISVLDAQRTQTLPLYEWCAEGVSPRPDELRFASHQHFPAAFDKLHNHRTIYVPDTEETSVSPDYEVYRRNQVKSVLVLPMQASQSIIYLLGFHAVREPRNWDAEIGLMKVFSEIFTNTLDRHKTEKALRESEERLRVVISNAPMFVFTFDAAGYLTFLAGERLATQGISDSSVVIGKHVDELRGVPFIQNVHRALRGESFASLDQKQTQHGVIAFQSWYGALRDPSGKLAGAIGVALDVSERVRVEAAEREQRTLADALRATSAVLTQSLDLNEVLRLVLDNVGRVVPNDAGTIILLDGDALRFACTRGRHEAIEAQLRENMTLPMDAYTVQTMLRTGKPCLIKDVHQSTDWYRVPEIEWIRSYLGVPIRAQDEIIGFLNLDSAEVGFFTDIHAEHLQAFADHISAILQNARLFERVRNNAEALEVRVQERTAELEAQQSQLKAILDSMTEGVIYGLFTPDPSAVYVNRAFVELTGYTLEDLAKADAIARLVAKPELFAPTYPKVLANLQRRGFWEGEITMTRKDGSAFDAHVTLCRMNAAATDDSMASVALIRDISQEKTLQLQKDRFIANASHELRTPLTNLKMRLYLLMRQPEQFHEHMEILERVTRRMQELVEDLLDVSRFDRGVVAMDREDVVLQDLIAETLEVQRPHADLKSITFHTDLPATSLVNNVDPGRITQVITNLVVNALNYTPEGGHITVRLQRETLAAGDMSIIEVEDTGIGIPEQALPHVFDPFFRKNVGMVRGTGLGLTICREIVDLHRGTITVRSTENVGTVFTVRLPIVDASTDFRDDQPQIGISNYKLRP